MSGSQDRAVQNLYSVLTQGRCCRLANKMITLYFSTWIETKSRGDLKAYGKQHERLTSNPCCFDYPNNNNKLPSAKYKLDLLAT